MPVQGTESPSAHTNLTYQQGNVQPTTVDTSAYQAGDPVLGHGPLNPTVFASDAFEDFFDGGQVKYRAPSA